MKKSYSFLVITIVVLVSLVACSDDCRCYELTEKYKYKTYNIDHEDGEEHEMHYIYYKWATPQGVRYWADERKVVLTRENNYGISITKKKVKDSWNKCEANEAIRILDGDTLKVN